MQTRNPFFDDLAKTMESAMGLAQAAGEEARSAFRAQGDRLAAEFDLVRRDELDAVRDALTAQIIELRGEIARLKPVEAASPGPGPGTVAVD
jgi:BMFP domain-containing protein YqiC